ncbi:hypothetical protein [Pedobacter sp. KACC 23697]|uniref:Uncharacterized protein n=1 Tax=Pedobacter sp. KACC 23697 TaxID=3149230 RepID=A0AAU7K0T4_9SPHI
MQPIRDKDFDQLFKDAFADAEVTPSRDLWSNIESEITPKKKRIIPVYWLSAAAVLLIATIGIWLYQQQNNTGEDKKLANNTIQKIKPEVKEPTADDTAATVVENVEPVLRIRPKAVSVIAGTKVKKEVKPITLKEKRNNTTAPEMLKQETIVAKVEEPKKDLRTKIEEAILQPKEEVVTAVVATPVKTDEPVNDNEQSNRGIRNVGDVVNLIVNKMDKRKDKLIQFRTDDDDSSLSSINIGPFKFGKKKK